MEIDPFDIRLNTILGDNPMLETLASGFHFLEGPVWQPHERYLIFSDIIGNRMFRWMPAQGVTTFREPSQMANGNTLDLEGRLLTCEHATSRVTRLEKDGTLSAVASHYQGKELNSPNDIVVKRDGAIYFTDPNPGRGARVGVPRPQELPFQGVFRLGPQGGEPQLLVRDMSKPNGLCFSLDESQLFVDDSDKGEIRVFDVLADGRLAGGRVWAKVGSAGVGVADGMKIDREGNLYCTGPGGIYLFDPSGQPLGHLGMPEQTANLAWGDDDLCSLYITATTTLYRLRVSVPGLAAF